jgi:hypothetical protein
MKRMLLVLIAIGSVIFASAQVQFGFKAAVNVADLNLSGGPSGFGFNPKTDFSGGILVSVPLLNSCSLQPEVLYSGQGASFNDSLETVKDNYAYVNVPVLFKYQHSSGLFAETGPQISFLLSANERANRQIRQSTPGVIRSQRIFPGPSVSDINYRWDLALMPVIISALSIWPKEDTLTVPSRIAYFSSVCFISSPNYK